MPYEHTFTHVFRIETGIAVFVFLIVAGFLTVGLVFYRAKRRERPSRKHEWSIVEGCYVVLVFCMAAFLVWLSLTTNAREKSATETEPALVVKVLGFQWCWRFSYPGHHTTVQGSCNLGKTLPTLVLPKNEPVRFELESNDVVHEFWLPHLRYKMELFPNHVNTFTATFATTGRWKGHCAEYCGLDHAYMQFYVHVVPPRAFDSWLSSHHGFHVE
ncbi:MAG: cytochrome c oxidase subunit II [Acidimicrobiales bacterium]